MQTYWTIILNLTRFPSESDAHYNLRITGLIDTIFHYFTELEGRFQLPRQHLSNFLSFSLMFPRRLPQLWTSRLHMTLLKHRKGGVSFWQGGISFTKAPKTNLLGVFGPCLVIPLTGGMELSTLAKTYQHSLCG